MTRTIISILLLMILMFSISRIIESAYIYFHAPPQEPAAIDEE